MVKVIIFDTDGMVITSDKLFSVRFGEEYKVPYNIILPFFKNQFQPCLVGKADLREQIKPYLEKWKWNKSVDDLLQYWFEAESNIDRELVKYIPKIKKAGIKCYLATNQEKYRTEYLRKVLNFETLFDKIYSSAEVGYKKPQLEFFNYILNDIKISKDGVQFWDDTEKNVQGARNFGLDARLYRQFEDFKREVSTLL